MGAGGGEFTFPRDLLRILLLAPDWLRGMAPEWLRSASGKSLSP